MLKYSELENTFKEKGIAIEEYRVELNEVEITTPFIAYTVTDGDSFNADGINYIKLLNVGLVVIDDTLNFSLQKAIENVFDENIMGYEKSYAFSDEDRLYSITYSFTVFDDNYD